MSIMEMVQYGREALQPIVEVIGPPGVGKSSWVAGWVSYETGEPVKIPGWPSPVFIQTEPGLNRISCAKFPRSRTLDDVVRPIQGLLTEPHGFLTLAIDSIDWLEHLIVDAICKAEKVRSLDKVHGPYGTGAAMVMNKWREIGDLLVRLQEERGMAIVLISHEKIKTMNTPGGESYDRWVPKLSDKSADYLAELAELIVHAHPEISMATVDAKIGKRVIAQPVGRNGGNRIMRCQPSPTCLSKTRFPNIPEQLEFSYTALAPYLNAEIESALKERADLDAAAGAVESSAEAAPEVAPVLEEAIAQGDTEAAERAAELERDNEWRRQQGLAEQLRTLAEEAEVMAAQEGETSAEGESQPTDGFYPPDQEGAPAAE